jgi:hypothetical protein
MFCLCIGPLSLVISKFSERPAAVQGARSGRGGGEFFPVLKKFSGAHPGRRGAFWNLEEKGKGAGVSGGFPLAGVRGSAPRTLPRAFLARGIQHTPPVPDLSPLLIATPPKGADPRKSRTISGSCWSSLRMGHSLPGTSFLPLAPLLSALVRARRPAARWGPSFWWGAAISAAISIDQDAERSQPHSDGCASLRCQPVPPFFRSRSLSKIVVLFALHRMQFPSL